MRPEATPISATGSVICGVLGWMGNRKGGRFRSLPLAGGWTKYRDFPAPQGQTFQAQWKAKRGGR